LAHTVIVLPCSYLAVCQNLVSTGEKQDEETTTGRKRMELLQTLCDMNPTEALFVRSLCVSQPSLLLLLNCSIFTVVSEFLGGGMGMWRDMFLVQ